MRDKNQEMICHGCQSRTTDGEVVQREVSVFMSFIAIDPELIESKGLFPLPLVAMEHFWIWDDVPLHPKRFRVVIELSGIVNVPRMERSIAIAAVRHPLLFSIIESKASSRQWIIPKEPRVGWRWNSGPWQESPFPDEWNLAVEGGLRIWGSQNGDAAEMSFETHHASSDALGLRQFLRDIFVAYDQLTKEPNRQPELPTLTYERLKERGVFSRPAPTEDTRSTTTWEKIVGAYHFHFKGPVPLAIPKFSSKARAATASRHHYFRHTFSRDETDHIEQKHTEIALKIFAAKSLGEGDSPEILSSHDTLSTLNDAAITRMMQVLTSWNAEHCPTPPRQRFRIMIPTDLRTLRDSRSPASNRLGFGFVVATQNDCGDFAKLLSSIRLQTQAIRKYRLGLDFVEIFGLLAKQPRIAEWLIRLPRCLATAVLTNMGDSFGRFRKLFEVVDGKFKVGDFFVESFAGYPPLRHKTLLGIGMSRCAGRLTMGVIVDGEKFSYDQAEKLYRLWIQSWLDSIER